MSQSRPEFQLHQPTYLLGIGGMGMSGLATALQSAGVMVAGSEREPDRGRALWLKERGISVHRQGDSGLEDFVREHPGTRVITSRAVEETVPELITARKLELPLLQRVDLLKTLVSRAPWPIAVAGTAGKTTTAALLSHLLRQTGHRPSHLVGGIIPDLGPGRLDTGPHFVYELDESDGRTAEYRPRMLLVTNLHEEHHDLETLRDHFRGLLRGMTGDAILLTGSPDPVFQNDPRLAPQPAVELVAESVSGLRIRAAHREETVPLPGQHNLANIRLALAAAARLGVPITDGLTALSRFPGIENRMRNMGQLAGGIDLLHDFAHAPVELAALIRSLERLYPRFTLVWQPHGFGPLQKQWQELQETFMTMRSEDTLLITEVYYGGGTVQRERTGRDLAEAVARSHPRTGYVPDLQRLAERLTPSPPGCGAIILAGARDIFDISPELLRKR